jgi:hypothetical protein
MPSPERYFRTAVTGLWLAVASGCGHVAIDQAITAHNVFRQMLLDASDSYKTMYGAAANKAMSGSDTEYETQMKPYDEIVSALRDCQAAEQTLRAILATCVSSGDETCDGSKIGFACAATALDSLSTSYGQIRGGAALYAATAIAKAQLTELANGAPCVLQP